MASGMQRQQQREQLKARVAASIELRKQCDVSISNAAVVQIAGARWLARARRASADRGEASRRQQQRAALKQRIQQGIQVRQNAENNLRNAALQMNVINYWAERANVDVQKNDEPASSGGTALWSMAAAAASPTEATGRTSETKAQAASEAAAKTTVTEAAGSAAGDQPSARTVSGGDQELTQTQKEEDFHDEVVREKLRQWTQGASDDILAKAESSDTALAQESSGLDVGSKSVQVLLRSTTQQSLGTVPADKPLVWDDSDALAAEMEREKAQQAQVEREKARLAALHQQRMQERHAKQAEQNDAAAAAAERERAHRALANMAIAGDAGALGMASDALSDVTMTDTEPSPQPAHEVARKGSMDTDLSLNSLDTVEAAEEAGKLATLPGQAEPSVDEVRAAAQAKLKRDMSRGFVISAAEQDALARKASTERMQAIQANLAASAGANAAAMVQRSRRSVTMAFAPSTEDLQRAAIDDAVIS